MKNKWKQFETWFNHKFGWIFNPSDKQGKDFQNSKYQ